MQAVGAAKIIGSLYALAHAEMAGQHDDQQLLERKPLPGFAIIGVLPAFLIIHILMLPLLSGL